MTKKVHKILSVTKIIFEKKRIISLEDVKRETLLIERRSCSPLTTKVANL